MNTFLPIRFAVAVALLAIPLVTACEDPSNVGIGLVGGEGGNPVDTTVAVIDMATRSADRPAGVPARVLAGYVDDPLLGRITAEGYMDFGSGGDDEFRSATVERAELRLLPSYVYGDTTGAVTLALRTVEEEWPGEGLPVDTTFPTGALVGEFTFQPTDTLVVVPLPEDWIAANDDTLRSETFAGGFHGFRLEHVSGNAIVGFGPNSTFLAAFTEDDSAAFAVARGYAALERTTPENVPDGRMLLQAGVGPHVGFQLDIEEADFSAHAVNRTALTFWTDTLGVQQNTPTGFVRPVLRTIDLVGIVPDESLVFLDRSEVDDQGRFVFRSEGLARELQRTLLGTRSYDRFELRIPAPATVSQNQPDLAFLSASINAVLLFDTSAEEHQPVTYLTVTPIDG